MLLHVLDIICGCEHDGFSSEHNDFVIKHIVIKNGELWNNILRRFLSIMYKCLALAL